MSPEPPGPTLYLFDDARARDWVPFHLTRPIGELLYGCLLLRERAERYWEVECRGHIAGEELLGFTEPGAPSTVVPGRVPTDEDRILVSSRVVPELETRPELPKPDEGSDMPRTLTLEGEVVGWHIPAGAPNPEVADLLDPGRGGYEAPPESSIPLVGEILRHPWDLISGNPERILEDVPLLFPHSSAFLPPEAEQIGDDFSVSTGRKVALEPGVVLDTRSGPIRLSDNVRIRSHTRLEGPVFVGSQSTILGGNLGAVSIGERCKVRGEVEETVIMGFSNKAHDGFLGHAYLGRWVNLGAMTTNSDLKNNYGTVRVRTPEREIDTGLLKFGCLLGDHVKTGIGTLLNTGTMVGAGANLFGGAMPPKYVPPFSWGSGHELGEYRIEEFLETAGTVMGRRDQDLPEEQRALLLRAWERTREERGGDRKSVV